MTFCSVLFAIVSEIKISVDGAEELVLFGCELVVFKVSLVPFVVYVELVELAAKEVVFVG